MQRAAHTPYIQGRFPCTFQEPRKPEQQVCLPPYPLPLQVRQEPCQEVPLPYNKYNRQQPSPCSMSHPD